MVNRTAFSMLELIFAIVLIAISVMSLPMLTQVTSDTSIQNIESDEAIFEAYVKAVEATDETFASIGNVGLTSVLKAGDATSLAGLKYAHQYKIDVTTPATFAGVTSTNIKELKITITDANGNVLTVLKTYKFNM